MTEEDQLLMYIHAVTKRNEKQNYHIKPLGPLSSFDALPPSSTEKLFRSLAGRYRVKLHPEYIFAVNFPVAHFAILAFNSTFRSTKTPRHLINIKSSASWSPSCQDQPNTLTSSTEPVSKVVMHLQRPHGVAYLVDAQQTPTHKSTRGDANMFQKVKVPSSSDQLGPQTSEQTAEMVHTAKRQALENHYAKRRVLQES